MEAQVQTLVTALLTPVQNALGGLEAAATPLWAACSGMIAGTFMLNALELIATGFHQRLFD